MMPRSAPFIVSALCMLAAPLARAAEPEVSLELLAAAQIPADQEGALRGISGLAYRPRTGTWIAVSDDKKRGADIFLELRFELEITPIAENVAVHRLGYEIVRSWGAARPRGATDAEAIAFDPTGMTMFIGFEKPPAIQAITEDIGARDFPVPREVVETAVPNRAFEAIAYRRQRGASGGDQVWAATEAALRADGPEATHEAGTDCRVLVFDAKSLELTDQFTYRTEPAPKGMVPSRTFNSLAEMEALPDGRILMLERGASVPRGYQVTFFTIDGTTTPGPPDRFPILDKRRIASSADLGLPLIGNLEAMALGPEIDDDLGGRLLIVMADDNFGADGQKGTQVLALRVRGLGQMAK